MQTPVSIHVAGDAYTAIFYLPHGRLFLNGIETAHAHAIPVGAEYIYRAIRAICDPQALLSTSDPKKLPDITLTVSPGTVPFCSADKCLAWYEISNVGNMSAHDDPREKLPLLRPSRAETQEVVYAGFDLHGKLDSNGGSPPNHDVLVHWLGELASKARKENERESGDPPNCKVHVQVGLAEPLQPADDEHKKYRPASLARPDVGRILVVNIGEISATHRIRRSLSYEAVAVDLLRFLRGDGARAKFNETALKQLSMASEDAPPWSVLAVRINNSAVFLYACEWKQKETMKERVEHAWLLCHKNECAPITQPELGQMVGYTGFVSAQLAASMANHIVMNGGERTEDFDEAIEAILAGVQRSLLWQRVSYERGCLHMLFERKRNLTNDSQAEWKPIESDAAKSRTEYEHMFADVVRTLKHEGKRTDSLAGIQGFNERLTQFDELSEKEVLVIKVQIQRAVAHRTQWFMARSVAAEKSNIDEIPDEVLEERFREVALSWLSKTGAGSEIKQPSESRMPIVTIADAELTDRREVEDFLAIHQALSVYAQSSEPKPLNIAVFGGPGSGKSFAVNQVVKHIGEKSRGIFKKEPLTFNLGQFKSLDDLPAALHLVRNECLSGEIPIVFFDEFDSSFNGQSFGWLKFFLAPMQDGEFYHDGQNYKIGRTVFAFAGGVNRSFEELNGRVRNPGFCEAKGPDFISRLKAHLNVQGINKPEDEADQSRYILRRGILLRGIVRKKLDLKKEQKSEELLNQSVAKALLSVKRFKHGVRSLEAIIKMCSTRPGHPIGPSDLPSMDQLDMHVDASELLRLVDEKTELLPERIKQIPINCPSVSVKWPKIRP
ncbi:MAG: P-loop NTPase family protein [Limisphaerales bacterium]